MKRSHILEIIIALMITIFFTGMYGLVGFMGCIVMVAGVALLTPTVSFMCAPSKWNGLDKMYEEYKQKVFANFDKKTAKKFAKIFLHQCLAAEGESDSFKWLTRSKEDLCLRELNNAVEFEMAFADYAKDLLSLDISTGEAMARELERGQKIIRDFDYYLSILSAETEVY